MVEIDTQTPVFDVQDEDFVLGVWFVPGDGVDWMCVIWRTQDGAYKGTYRFRYYAEPGDDDPFSGKDHKSITHIDGKPGVTESGLIGNIDIVASMVGGTLGGPVSFVPVRGNGGAALVDALARQPWAHIKVLKNDSPASPS